MPRGPMACEERGANCFAPFPTLDHRTTKGSTKYDKVGQVWLVPLYISEIHLPRMRCRDRPGSYFPSTHRLQHKLRARFPRGLAVALHN